MIFNNRLEPELSFWDDIWFTLYQIAAPYLTQSLDLMLTFSVGNDEIDVFSGHLRSDGPTTYFSKDKASARLVTSPNLPLVPDQQRIRPESYLLISDSNHGNNDDSQVEVEPADYLVVDHVIFGFPNLGCFDVRSLLLSLILPHHEQCLHLPVRPCDKIIRDKTFASSYADGESLLGSFGKLKEQAIPRDRSSVAFVSSRPLLLHMFVPGLSTNQHAITPPSHRKGNGFAAPRREPFDLDTDSTNREVLVGSESRPNEKPFATVEPDTGSLEDHAGDIVSGPTYQDTESSISQTNSPTTERTGAAVIDTGLGSAEAARKAKRSINKQNEHEKKRLLVYLEEHGKAAASGESSVTTSREPSRKPATKPEAIESKAGIPLRWFTTILTCIARPMIGLWETISYDKMLIMAFLSIAAHLLYVLLRRLHTMASAIGDEYQVEHAAFRKMVNRVSAMESFDRSYRTRSERLCHPGRSISDITISRMVLPTVEGDRRVHRCTSDNDIITTQIIQSNQSESARGLFEPARITRINRGMTAHLLRFSFSDSSICHVTMSTEEMGSDHSLYRCFSSSDVTMRQNPSRMQSTFSELALTTACSSSLTVPLPRKSHSFHDSIGPHFVSKKNREFPSLIRCRSFHEFISMEGWILPVLERAHSTGGDESRIIPRIGESLSESGINHVTASGRVDGNNVSHRCFSDDQTTVYRKPNDNETSHAALQGRNQRDAVEDDDANAAAYNMRDRQPADAANRPAGYPAVASYDLTNRVSLNGGVVPSYLQCEGTDVDTGLKHEADYDQNIAEIADNKDHHGNGFDLELTKKIFWQHFLDYLYNSYR